MQDEASHADSYGMSWLLRDSYHGNSYHRIRIIAYFRMDCLERPAEPLVFEKIRVLNWSNDNLLLPVSLPITTTTTMSPVENPTSSIMHVMGLEICSHERTLWVCVCLCACTRVHLQMFVCMRVCLCTYRVHWLLSACVYSTQQGSMCLTASVHLIMRERVYVHES